MCRHRHTDEQTVARLYRENLLLGLLENDLEDNLHGVSHSS